VADVGVGGAGRLCVVSDGEASAMAWRGAPRVSGFESHSTSNVCKVKLIIQNKDDYLYFLSEISVETSTAAVSVSTDISGSCSYISERCSSASNMSS
jgi:hypothetical protein